MRPPPVRIGVDKPSNQRSHGRTNKRRTREDRHRSLHLVSREHVTHCTARDGQEGTPCQTLEEAGDNHGLYVVCHGRRDEPDEEEGKGGEVDGAAAVELGQRAPEGAQCYAEHESGQPQRRDDARVAELLIHLGVGRRVDGAGIGDAEAADRGDGDDGPFAPKGETPRVQGVAVAALPADLVRVFLRGRVTLLVRFRVGF